MEEKEKEENEERAMVTKTKVLVRTMQKEIESNENTTLNKSISNVLGNYQGIIGF